MSFLKASNVFIIAAGFLIMLNISEKIGGAFAAVFQVGCYAMLIIYIFGMILELINNKNGEKNE